MSDDAPAKTSNALIHIDGDSQAVGEAAKLFLQIVNDAVGGWLKPWQIRRVADAEADAKLTHAMADIRATSLQKRAAQRWLAEEEAKQANMESITAKALPHVKPDAQPGKIERDWLTNFFDKSRLTSDAEMQELWAKILAGEANAPGRFSRRTINLMASLDKSDAELFGVICRFSWGDSPIIFNPKEEPYSSLGLTWSKLVHLDEVGLITFENLGLVASNVSPIPFDPADPIASLFVFSYFGTQCFVYPGKDKKEVKVGRVKFSRVGSDLSSLSAPNPVPGFVDYVVQNWQKAGCTVLRVEKGQVFDFSIFEGK